MENKYKYNTIEEALEELRQGKIILVSDDPDRENEGDMICAAEFATQLHRYLRKGIDLYTNECRNCRPPKLLSNGLRKSGQPRNSLHCFS